MTWEETREGYANGEFRLFMHGPNGRWALRNTKKTLARNFKTPAAAVQQARNKGYDVPEWEDT